jgi:energy-coupling factor transporter ATP-binding protein EcfA2
LRNFSTKEDIKKAFFENDPENKNPTNDVLALWEFAYEMSPGDVIIAKRGRSTYLGYGIVTGDYIFNDQVEEGYHVRKVDWKKHGEWEDPLGTFALKTLTHITNLETSSPDYDTYVDRIIDLIGIELDEQPQALERTPETMINYTLIQELQSACKEAGLQYPEKLLQRFTASLLAKRFLILTGLSGSGKTKLAQAFTEWLGNSTATTDPFYAGAGIESSQKTYRVAKSDSLAVEFWNDESEENSTKVTLGREMIKEWANCISENNFTKETSPRAIRDVINETSQFSPQLHSFETHLKAAAFAFIESQKNEFSHECTEIIPIGSDWTSNENILGYPDGLNPNTYNSTPILDLLLRAELKADLPHFLILDEMNLSHVERYFADMLSAIESDEAIPLYEGNYDDQNSWRLTSTKKKIPPKVKLPKNLFVIGTVNVDETTYMFSPKVLDRANVIEFRVESEDMENFLNSGSQKPDLSKLAGTGSLYAKQFVPAQFSEISNDNQFSDEINRFFKIFSEYDAEFGFRVANEASRLINFQKLLGSDSFNENFDAVIIQKFLPKLHGSRSQLEELLQELIDATISNENQEWADEHLDYQSPTYPLSFNKLCRMYRKLQRDQFVSFAEA